MVCPRCIMVLEKELQCLGTPYRQVIQGQILLKKQCSEKHLKQLEKRIELLGFGLIHNKEEILTEQIKQFLIADVRTDIKPNIKLSVRLSITFKTPYHVLNKVFTKYTSSGIMRFFVLQRIEHIKELISYNELTLEQIAFELDYKDLSYMSKQFKQVVGMSPSQYKKFCTQQRMPLDEVL